MVPVGSELNAGLDESAGSGSGIWGSQEVNGIESAAEAFRIAKNQLYCAYLG